VIQPGGAPRVVVPADRCRDLAVHGRKIQKGLRRQVDTCTETPECGGKLQRRAAHPLPQRAGVSQTVQPNGCGKEAVEILANQPGRPRRGRAPDAVPFEQDYWDACRGQTPRAGHAGQAAANDHDPGLKAGA
jgi:hypothetical protein